MHRGGRHSTEYEKVIAAAAKMDKPFGSYETGYGVKFDKTMQNTRALPLIAQWQQGPGGGGLSGRRRRGRRAHGGRSAS